MKANRAILLIIIILAVVAAVVWMKKRAAAAGPSGDAAAAQKPADEEGEGPKVSRDADGKVVITMTDEAQGDMGILVKKPEPLQISPERKGYGRVLDPTPLAALVTELASAQAAYSASSNELARLKTLEGQGNATTRALQTAEATALHDRLAVQAAKDRLSLSWGKPVTEQKDLSAFVQSLTALDSELVRIDLPVGESLKSPPASARIQTLAGESLEAQFLGSSPTVDPQMEGQGYLFLIKPEGSRLSTGQAVVGYLKVAGEPLKGVVIPREAVVRTEGAGWIYVLKPSGEAFSRVEVPLDHPVEAGWFVVNGVTAGDFVVVTAAQQLLSIELKGQGGE